MRDSMRITPNLIVGKDQPTEADLQEMAMRGVRTVIDLRQAGEGNQPLPPPDEGIAARRFGMTYRHLPMGIGVPSKDTLDLMHDELARLPTPIFIHCASGKRSGMVALMHHAINEKMTSEQMMTRAEELGVAYGSDAVKDAYRRYVDHKVAPQFTERM